MERISSEGQRLMEKVYDIENFEVNLQRIKFEISQQLIEIPLSKTGSRLLSKATEKQLQVFEIDYDGIGVYWPLLDEDLSIAGLLRSAGREDLVVHQIGSIPTTASIQKAS